MNESTILLVCAPHASVRTWTETLEKILAARVRIVDPRQVPISELRGVYSLILVDSMPDQRSTLASLDLCRRIRKHFDDPIIFLSHDDRERSMIDAYTSEIDECIIKPISLPLLATKIKSWLRWSSVATFVYENGMTANTNLESYYGL